MNVMPTNLFLAYVQNPLGLDSEVRRVMKIPEDRYYCVSVWPPGTAGRVTLTGSRAVRAAKISKSDQP
jgi:hypothetical protein